MLSKAPGDMHRAQRVLKAAMLRCRKDPTGTLQLGNGPQTLHPRRVDEIALCRLVLSGERFDRYGKRNIAMDWIGDQLHPLEMRLRCVIRCIGR